MSEARPSVTSTLAARNGGRAGLAVLATILLLGLGLRLDCAWEGRDPVFDATSYAEIARNLDVGRGFTLGEGATQPASNYSPGLPLLVTSVYELSGGEHQRLARIVLALIGSLAIPFTYLIGRRLSGPVAGLIGAAAIAIYPALLEYQGMLMGEPLAATLLSGAVLAMLWAEDPRQRHPARGWRRGGVDSPSPEAAERKAPSRLANRPRSGAARRAAEATPPRRQDPRERWLLPGALLGALALVRPEYLGVAIMLGLVVLLTPRRRAEKSTRGPLFGPSTSGLAEAAVLLAGVTLVVAPWTIRNAIALDRFVPVSTGGGQVLFAGTYLPSGGDPERVGREVLERHPGLTRQLAAEHLPAGALLPHSGRKAPLDAVLERVRLEQILAALAAQRYPEQETDRALARMGRERLWDDVTEEPLEYAGFLAAKVWRIWARGPRDVMGEPAWRVLHLTLVALALLGLAALAFRRDALLTDGIDSVLRSRWEALLLATVFLSITAVGAMLVASPRRTLVALPLLAASAGVGAAWLWARLRKHPAQGPSDELTPP